MKTTSIFTLLFLLTLTVSSQVVTVTMKRWTTFDFPGNLSLHDALDKDSVNSKSTFTGQMVYIFDLDNKVISMSSDNGWESVFNIKVIIPTTQSILNIDAEQDGIFYNFMLTENINNQMSLVAQRFDLVEGNREGFFSNSVQYYIK